MKASWVLLLVTSPLLAAQPVQSGLIGKPGHPLFPIGSYELPKDDAGLRALAEAGFNLVRCHSHQDLDRAAATGLEGWVPVPLQIGAGGKLRGILEGLADHPALAVWEGPDEVVWNFTAYSGLFRNGTYPAHDEWWRQTPLALEHAEKEAARIIPNLRAAAGLVREVDKRARPIWINEAARSDLKYIRDYLDAIDITGCDIYPIHAASRNPIAAAGYTARFQRVGRGHPVWMVLQGFAWGELKGITEAVTYPTFAETRLMAWLALAHGARGILYWGMDAAPPKPAFRESVYAMASELAALQPFLSGPDVTGVRAEVIDSEGFDSAGRGVGLLCRAAGRDRLVALVNEDDRPHFGVAVTGLRDVSRLELLYSMETAAVKNGEFITRLLPFEVKIFATSRRFETGRKAGRDFVAP